MNDCNHEKISYNDEYEVWYCEKCGEPFEGAGAVSLVEIVNDLRAELARLRSERQWIPVSEKPQNDENKRYLALAGKDFEPFIVCFYDYWFLPYDEYGDEFSLEIHCYMEIPTFPEAL